MKRLFFALLFIIGLFAFVYAEEYTFDVSEIEKKPYHIGGYLEFKPALFGLDKKASLYKLKFYNRDEGSKLEEYDFTLQLEGSLEKGIVRLFVRGLIKTRVAIEDEAKAEVINTTEGNAEGARGHVDCMEIVKDNAIAKAIPIVNVTNPLAKVTHEAAIGSVDKL